MLQHLKYKDLLVFFDIFDSKCTFSGFWTVDWTTEGICRCSGEIVINNLNFFLGHFTDQTINQLIINTIVRIIDNENDG